jgi:hypothetical protein
LVDLVESIGCRGVERWREIADFRDSAERDSLVCRVTRYVERQSCYCRCDGAEAVAGDADGRGGAIADLSLQREHPAEEREGEGVRGSGSGKRSISNC